MNSKSHANGHSKSESVTLINIILRLPSVSPFFRKEYSIYTKTDEGDWPKTFNGMTQTFDDTWNGIVGMTQGIYPNPRMKMRLDSFFERH